MNIFSDEFNTILSELIQRAIEDTVKTTLEEIIGKIKPNEKLTLNINETSQYAGINEEKIRQLVHTQDFPCFKNGNKWLINRELLDEWLKKISKEHKQI